MDFLNQFAAESGSAATPSLFSTLGIDWRLVILQIIAFLILMVILGKFVFPWLMKQVDERQANIEAAAEAATVAQKAAADSQEKTAEQLDAARKEAAEIVNTAKLEAAELLKHSEDKARKNADRIVSDAKVQIDKDIAAARTALYNDTVELVGRATEKIVGTELTSKLDAGRIEQALKEVK